MAEDDGGLEVSDSDKASLDALLAFLHRERGFDLTGYKTASLARRIRRRMHMVSATTYTAYVDYLQVHPDEFLQLFNSILINVTAFFRDPSSWEAVREHLSRLVQSRDGRAVRVWCAGCASGEEAYTIAMVLCDLLGPADFGRRVKIYATDIDDDALVQARTATYGSKSLEGLPPGHADKYFVESAGSYTFAKELRRVVIFGRHDLVQDAPISRVDMLSCRNTLMYFNAETQLRILQRLNFALADDGLLFLGKAEMLLTHTTLFTPLDLKLRLFRRARTGRVRERLVRSPVPSPADGATPHDAVTTKLQRAAFDSAPVAQIVIDTEGRVALVNHRAASLFSLTAHDIGRPFQDLEVSYRPAELRSRIDRVRADNRSFSLREIERVSPSGEKTFLDIELTPVRDSSGETVGVQVDFVDVTEPQRLRAEVTKANLELEAAHEALQSTSEELETTNEELQSTVEELETTNEELQSTNEELETMNEELQSTNEELQSTNEELQSRDVELNKVNGFFASILASLSSGVVVLDGNLHVKAWNSRMEELWGMRADEALDKHFLNLDIGLPVDQLAAVVRASVATASDDQRVLACTNRRGKVIQCRITASPMRTHDIRGVIVMVEELAP